jgi:peptidoglycan-associated lipoprotein
MLRNHIVLPTLALLALGCAHQEVKPTPAPTSKAAPAAPTAAVAEAPTPVAPAAETRPTLTPIYFEFDRADLHADDTQILATLGEYLLAHTEGLLTIAGHCDERGTIEYNIALGDRRAVAARDYLVRLGIDASRVKTISYGEAKPADEGHDEAAWAKNRRDEFQVERKQRADAR